MACDDIGLGDPIEKSVAELTPVSTRERVAVLDVIRGWALLGVLIANIHEVISGKIYGFAPKDTALPDQIATGFIRIAISARSITLLTFLFGMGFAIQLMRAESRGEDGRARFLRRLAALFAIGACHATLLWWGDVASTYAIVGLALLAFRRASPRALLAWAAALVFLPAMIASVPAIGEAVRETLPHPANQAEFTAYMAAAMQHGDFTTRVAAHSRQAFYFLAGACVWYLPWILGRFLLGYYAGRRRLFERDGAAHLPLFRRLLVVGLVCAAVGTPAMLLRRADALRDLPLVAKLGLVVTNEFAWLGLAAVYASAIVLLMQRPGARRWLLVLAPVGQMPLSTYISQSVIATFVFYGFGLGLAGHVGSAGCLGIAVGIYALQVLACRLWLRRFRFGPLEWLWRVLVYGRAAVTRPATTSHES